jgi:hypothetical protein
MAQHKPGSFGTMRAPFQARSQPKRSLARVGRSLHVPQLLSRVPGTLFAERIKPANDPMPKVRSRPRSDYRMTNPHLSSAWRMSGSYLWLSLVVFGCSGSSTSSDGTGGSSAGGANGVGGSSNSEIGGASTTVTTKGGDTGKGGSLGSGGTSNTVSSSNVGGSVPAGGSTARTNCPSSAACTTCGAYLCGPGEYCCNSACGICGPAGGPCPNINCVGTGGGNGVGQTCTQNSDCASGLLCCYPCGTAGCTNQCMQPGPNGACPMFA